MIWWRVALWLIVVIVVLALAVIALTRYGAARWQARTETLQARLAAARAPLAPKTFDPRELDALPPPVQRYFRTVLKDGQPLVAAVRVEHVGEFNMSESGEQWKPFTSTQRVITRRPGFIWDARMPMFPGLAVHVHDAYVDGEGILHAELLGLLPVMDMHGTPEVARGELMRFFAEAAWYPTALLPSQGVDWQAIDGRSAQATLRDGDVELTMTFQFDQAGLICSARAEDRGRAVGGTVVPTPWEGRWENYERRDGMLIPAAGEVAWLLPEGRKPYWRGRIAAIEYEFAD